MTNPFSLLRSSLMFIHKRRAETIAADFVMLFPMMERLIEVVQGILEVEGVLFKKTYAWEVNCRSIWFSDLSMFLSEGISAIGYREPFFRRIACPMLQIEKLLAMNDVPNRKEAAMALAQQLPESEWKSATTKWIQHG